MRFSSTIQGIPCLVNVIRYTPFKPMLITGLGMGDCLPPEPEEFEYEILDRKGYKASWLEKKITPDIEQEILEDYLIMKKAEYYDY